MKRGSALLLVLGMLSFMVISAVAFSAFMRYSRLPSSYLRRTSSSRLLVKAALAEAIDIVDAAVADNPAPGVGCQMIYHSPRRNGSKPSADWYQTRNHWRCHVFTGTSRLPSASETVSTLTLEGLAYLPPALINEARYYSRHSTAAAWHNFGYDSGRFAFCAVDVSDHLNVNKIAADIGRGSAPGNRLSLSYMFEDDTHAGYGSNPRPQEWDQFMRQNGFENNIPQKAIFTPWDTPPAAGMSSKLPPVSLADLNLAVNNTAFSKYFPFISVVTRSTTEYVTEEEGAKAEMQRNMTFVTDSYFPPSEGSTGDAAGYYDLANQTGQPFTKDELDQENVSLRAFVTKGIGASETGNLLRNRIAVYGLVSLYDYLDEDQVPVSLALPQVERSPMICGIRQENLDGKLAIKKTLDPDLPLTDVNFPNADYGGGTADTALSRTIDQAVYYNIDGEKFHEVFDKGQVAAVVAYPFRQHGGCDDSGSYALEGHLEFFFTCEAQGFRTDSDEADILHMKGDDDFKRDEVVNRAVFHVPLNFTGAEGITPSDFGGGADEETSAVKEYYAKLRDGGSALGNIPTFLEDKNNALLKVVYRYTQRRVKDEMSGAMSEWENVGDEPKAMSANVGVWPVKKGLADDSVNANALANLSGNTEYTLRAAVWLRIRNTEESGKNTVDLVPACVHDDYPFVGNHNENEPESINMTGKAYPLMLFSGGSFRLNKEELETLEKDKKEIAFGLMPQGVMVSDPRWNWAPEHWYRFDTVSESTWLQEVRNVLGKNGRDPDIFMATSDANYMQSVYELAFLPRLTDLENTGGAAICGNMTLLADAERTDWANAFADVAANRHLMWCTYRPYGNVGGDGGIRDNFEGLGIVSEGGGAKVNPYGGSVTSLDGSTATKVNADPLMAAFANTPANWWAASANMDTGVPKDERTAAQFNKKYAFSMFNSDAKLQLDWFDLVSRPEDKNSQTMDNLPVVENFCYRLWRNANMRGNSWLVDDWMDVYDELWAEGEKEQDRDRRLMGVKLEDTGSQLKLYGVDRKFLYGYWHDCLDMKQQLFLIFVRAEPMMMGGGAIGQTPPQLGARAVALVWRNPRRTENEITTSPNGPHQTRVLFYRQFD